MSEPCILAVDAGGTSLKAMLVRPEGGPVPGSFLQVPVDSQGAAREIAGAYRALARAARDASGEAGLSVAEVKVCIPGPFDYAAGISRMRHKYQSVYGAPMRPWFQEALGPVPVSFLHDSTAFLLGAATEENLRRHQRICGVILGTGLGFASMYNGRMNLTPQGGPGISVFARPYRDGSAEDYASRRAVENAYARLRPGRPVPTVREIAGLAAAGDPGAARCFEELGRCLGEILRDILEEEGFTLLLLGGAISKSAGLFLPALSGSLKGLAVEARPAEDIDLAPLLGAARA